MIINHNIPALNTLRQLNSNSGAASTSLERLSSGLRINSAADDAAGLAISEKMKTQIRGLDQASRNAQDGISLIQTAEGALEETESILQRMRELAVQATNDTNTDDDRTEIQAEIDQLIEEIDRISDTTEFNTKKLLNGNVASTATVSGDTAGIDTAVVEDATLDSGTYTLTVSAVTAAAVADFVDAGTGAVVANVTIGSAATASLGSYQLKVTEDTDNAGKYVLSLIDATSGEELASQNNVTIGTGGDTVTLNGIQIVATGMTGEGTVTFDVEADATFTLTQGTTTVATVTSTDLNESNIDISGLNVSFNANLAAGAATITIVNNSLTMQIGANSGQTMSVAINDMGSIALGVDALDVSTADGAEDAIDSIDAAVALVSHERAKLGAYQNRLEHTINNLGTSSENLSSAQSNIADVDMAKEETEYTKWSILVQSATAMLAQANTQPQNVLSLLSQ